MPEQEVLRTVDEVSRREELERSQIEEESDPDADDEEEDRDEDEEEDEDEDEDEEEEEPAGAAAGRKTKKKGRQVSIYLYDNVLEVKDIATLSDLCFLFMYSCMFAFLYIFRHALLSACMFNM